MHDNDGPLTLSVTLTLEGYDYSHWGTSGSDGLWLGIGIGSRTMQADVGPKADMILCEFSFNNQSSDEFLCFDSNSDSFASPPRDSR